MKNHILLSALSTTILAINMYAASTGSISAPDWRWVGAFSAGPVWLDTVKNQTLNLAPRIEKTYTASRVNPIFEGELFLGSQSTLSPMVQGQLGLAIADSSNLRFAGDIWDDTDPLFNNYNYNYKIQHTNIAVKGKLLWDGNYWLMPWLSGGIGLGINHAHHFNSSPTIYPALPTPNFDSHTETSFTYSVGVGLQKALNANWQVGAGYEFSDWGASYLGRASEQTTNKGPGYSHLYTNGLLFNVTYLI